MSCTYWQESLTCGWCVKKSTTITTRGQIALWRCRWAAIPPKSLRGDGYEQRELRTSTWDIRRPQYQAVLHPEANEMGTPPIRWSQRKRAAVSGLTERGGAASARAGARTTRRIGRAKEDGSGRRLAGAVRTASGSEITRGRDKDGRCCVGAAASLAPERGAASISHRAPGRVGPGRADSSRRNRNGGN